MLESYVECILAKLSHRLVVYHFHVFALWLNPRRTLFQLFQVYDRHLINVDESLIVFDDLCLFASLPGTFAFRWVGEICSILALDLVELSLIEVS